MAPATKVSTGRRRSRLARQEAWAFRLFTLPWLLGFLLLLAGPIVFSFSMSLTRWDLGQPVKFIGLANYVRAFRDPLVWQSLKVTSAYTFISVPLGLAFSLLVAMLMNQRLRGIALFRTIYYLPSVLSGVPVALLWIWLLNRDYGLLNGLMASFGIQGPDWLGSKHWVIPSFILMSLWGFGSSMIIFLAGLQGVPQELYEAAELDGAGRWHKFRYVTLPMISSVLFFNLIMGLIGSFQVFTSSFVMTDGGPDNASLFYLLYLYRNAWVYFKMGYASALAWILFAIILAFTLLVVRSSHAWVYYEGQKRTEEG